MRIILLLAALLFLLPVGCSRRAQEDALMVESCKVGCVVCVQDLEESEAVPQAQREQLLERCNRSCERLPYMVRTLKEAAR